MDCACGSSWDFVPSREWGGTGNGRGGSTRHGRDGTGWSWPSPPDGSWHAAHGWKTPQWLGAHPPSYRPFPPPHPLRHHARDGSVSSSSASTPCSINSSADGSGSASGLPRIPGRPRRLVWRSGTTSARTSSQYDWLLCPSPASVPTPVRGLGVRVRFPLYRFAGERLA